MSIITPIFNPQWYKNFIQHTNEKKLLVSKIAELLEGESCDSCLEIGLGISPYFAKQLSKNFKKYIIVEKRLIEEELPRRVRLINADWEKVNPVRKGGALNPALSENKVGGLYSSPPQGAGLSNGVKLKEKFDIIIASHVIYYFKDKQKAIDKMFDTLKDNGRIIFVVNGKSADYGSLKLAFSKMINKKYIFTYDDLINSLKGRPFKEYTLPSPLQFLSFEELFETLRLSFDSWPDEYEKQKDKIISYLKENIKSGKFIIDQKIIEVKR